MDKEEGLEKLIKLKPSESGKLRIKNYLINYKVWGKGKPLLLIHGVNIGWGQWYQNIPDLAKKRKVYILDLPGSGNSTKVDFKKTNFERDFVNVVQQFLKLKKITKIDVIGHSFGGAIVLSLIIKKDKRIDKVILVNPMGFSSYVPNQQKILSIYQLAKFLSKTAMKPTRENIRKFLLSVLIKKITLADEFIDYYYQAVKEDQRSHPFLFMNAFMKNFKIKKNLIFIDKLPQINKEILLIFGSKDPIIKQQKNLDNFKLIPKIKIKLLANVGHVPFLEESVQFNKIVINYLK